MTYKRTGLAILLVALTFAAALWAATPTRQMAPVLTALVRPTTPYVNALVLAASTAETFTAPTWTEWPGSGVVVAISATCADWYTRSGGTAVVPAGDVTDGTGSERNPPSFRMAQAATLSVIAPTTCTVTFACTPN